MIVESNAVQDPVLHIPVRGYLELPVAFDPPALFLREVQAGAKAAAEVQVEMPKGMDWSSLNVAPSEEGSFAAELLPRGHGACLKVHWRGAKQPGIYHGEIRVSAGGAKDAIPAKLPCTVEVVPEISAFPPSLCIEKAAGQLWRRQLSIESRREIVAKPSFCWSDAEVGTGNQIELTQGAGRSLRITVSGRVPADYQPKVLHICIGDNSILVPVRFIRAPEE